MNIFALDMEPAQAAQWHVDRHVVKMPIEYGQLLSTAHFVLDGKVVGYEPSHINHPSAMWLRRSRANYAWLYQLFTAVGEEYAFRYGRKHQSWIDLCEVLRGAPDNAPAAPDFVPPTPAMPSEYVVKTPDGCAYDSVASYRRYYLLGKAHLHKWSRRCRPEWCRDY